MRGCVEGGLRTNIVENDWSPAVILTVPEAPEPTAASGIIAMSIEVRSSASVDDCLIDSSDERVDRSCNVAPGKSIARESRINDTPRYPSSASAAGVGVHDPRGPGRDR